MNYITNVFAAAKHSVPHMHCTESVANDSAVPKQQLETPFPEPRQKQYQDSK